MGVLEDTWEAISTGDTLTDQVLRDLAQQLPPSYAITYTFAGEIGIDGAPLNGGIEVGRTWVYDSQGGRTGLSTGAFVVGTADGLPIEGAVEIGIAYLGESGVSSLSGFGATLEAGVIVGGGLTVPLRFADYTRHAADVLNAISSGDTEAAINLISSAPEGSILFSSQGLQAGGGFEVSYSVSDGQLSAFFSNPNYHGPQSFDSAQYQLALAYVEGGHGPARVQWSFEHGGEEFQITQQFESVTATREGGMIVNLRTNIIGPDGNRLTASELREFGFTHLTERVYVKDGGFSPGCFAAGTPIDMWPLDPALTPAPDGTYDQDAVRAGIWQKPIEEVAVSDLVVAFDKAGNLVPGFVPRTFQKDVKILLNFHGTQVTPGHVYLRPDSSQDAKFETLIDVLRGDGVIQAQDGTLIRAATNAAVDGPLDGFVQAVTGPRNADGSVAVIDQGRIRLGTRFIVDGTRSYCIGDLIAAGGGIVDADGFIRAGDSDPMPFHWEFGDTLPKPEDFVLACSGTTLEDIYKAAEWESQQPQMPAPLVLDRGPVQPVSGTARSMMPRNEPLQVVHAGESSEFQRHIQSSPV